MNIDIQLRCPMPSAMSSSILSRRDLNILCHVESSRFPDVSNLTRHNWSPAFVLELLAWCIKPLMHVSNNHASAGQDCNFPTARHLKLLQMYSRLFRTRVEITSDSIHLHSMVDRFKCASRIVSNRGCRFMDAHCQPLVTFLSYLCLPLCRSSQLLKGHVESSRRLVAK